MPQVKQKTNKSIAKRVKITGRGKLMIRKPGTGHLRSRKTAKRLRRMRQSNQIPSHFVRSTLRQLGVG